MKVSPDHGRSNGTDMQIYKHTDAYFHVIDLLENAARTFDPAAPDCLRTRLTMILGEVGGIWPMSCYTGEDEGAVIVAA